MDSGTWIQGLENLGKWGHGDSDVINKKQMIFLLNV